MPRPSHSFALVLMRTLHHYLLQSSQATMQGELAVNVAASLPLHGTVYHLSCATPNHPAKTSIVFDDDYILANIMSFLKPECMYLLVRSCRTAHRACKLLRGSIEVGEPLTSTSCKYILSHSSLTEWVIRDGALIVPGEICPVLPEVGALMGIELGFLSIISSAGCAGSYVASSMLQLCSTGYVGRYVERNSFLSYFDRCVSYSLHGANLIRGYSLLSAFLMPAGAPVVLGAGIGLGVGCAAYNMLNTKRSEKLTCGNEIAVVDTRRKLYVILRHLYYFLFLRASRYTIPCNIMLCIPLET